MGFLSDTFRTKKSDCCGVQIREIKPEAAGCCEAENQGATTEQKADCCKEQAECCGGSSAK
jgi:hypothetical protein